MYFAPTLYRCEQGHEFKWGPDEPYYFWPSTAVTEDSPHRIPLCPICWNTWAVRERLIMKPIPVEERTK